MISEVTNVDIMTMPTLMKLLAISKVASNLLGWVNKVATNFSEPEREFFKFSSIGFVSEKKATSAPATIAEQSNNKTIMKMPKMTPTGIADKILPEIIRKIQDPLSIKVLRHYLVVENNKSVLITGLIKFRYKYAVF